MASRLRAVHPAFVDLPTESSALKAGAAWLIASIGWLPVAHAQDIHKCATSSGIAYQTAPCGDGQTEVAVITTSRPAARTARSEAHATDAANNPERRDATATDAANKLIPVRPTAQWMPSGRQVIAPGASDDQVLNAPNWGVPSRISRWRDKRAWHEVWLYESRHGDARQLSFINGKLTDIDAGGPAATTRLAVARN